MITLISLIICVYLFGFLPLAALAGLAVAYYKLPTTTLMERFRTAAFWPVVLLDPEGRRKLAGIYKGA